MGKRDSGEIAILPGRRLKQFFNKIFENLREKGFLLSGQAITTNSVWLVPHTTLIFSRPCLQTGDPIIEMRTLFTDRAEADF
jgi:hypothetical protein